MDICLKYVVKGSFKKYSTFWIVERNMYFKRKVIDINKLKSNKKIN